MACHSRGQQLQQVAVSLYPTAGRLLGRHHLPGHRQRTAARPQGPRHTHDQAGHPVPQRGGVQGQHQGGALPQAEDPAQQGRKATAHCDRGATVPAPRGGSVAHPHAQQLAQPPLAGSACLHAVFSMLASAVATTQWASPRRCAGDRSGRCTDSWDSSCTTDFMAKPRRRVQPLSRGMQSNA